MKTAYDILKESGDINRDVIAALVDGVVCDLASEVKDGAVIKPLTFADADGKKVFWHTSSHILAQAVKRLYPGTKLAIGPAIDNGFYYDFDSDISFTPEALEKIEGEMKKIIKENARLERFTLPRDEAISFMDEKNEPYKVQLINELPEDAEISFYKMGDFTDLCAGPHLFSTGSVKAFKLIQCTGAYWKGSEKNKMLQRIYGISYPTKDELASYLEKVEEAKKRDHNKIGRELGYFTTVDIIGQGLPIILPKGNIVIRTLQRFVEDEEERRGYLQTRTPLMAKRELYKISGHWDHYRDGMFIMGDPEKFDDPNEEIFALRPMTCPFQFQAYLNEKRSYRDLPLRYNETSTLFRNESSGEMHGLIRVRQFTISEGHLACRPDQLEEEFAGCLDLARYMLQTLGLDEDVTYRFSKWDENDRDKYIGDASEWEAVQNTMRNILNDLNIDYYEADGEAAFYGPKLDIQIKNVHGKEDTLITIQIDFQLAERFGMEYTDSNDKKQYPYVIHRTSIGCYERTLALLIEKYAGAMPMWLAPTQVKLLPIGEAQYKYADEIADKMKKLGMRIEIDKRNEKIGYKIRQAQLAKIPYMLVIGEKEMNEGTVAVRSRKEGDLGAVPVDEFITRALLEINNKTR